MSKLKLLDPTNLSDVELRLQVLGTRLEKLQKTQATVQDADKQNKVRSFTIKLACMMCVRACMGAYMSVCGEYSYFLKYLSEIYKFARIVFVVTGGRTI